MAYRLNAFTGELDLVNSIPDDVVREVDTDSGIAIPANNILNIFGESSQGTHTSGSGNTVVINIFDATTTQKGSLRLATDAESIAGALTTNISINPSSLKAKLGTQTARGIPYGAGTTSAIAWTSAMTNGDLLIGNTGNPPALGHLTSGDGSIAIINGTGTIDIRATGPVGVGVVLVTTDSGTFAPDGANNINLLGNLTQGVQTSGTVSTGTITVLDATTAQKGVSELATDAESIDGTLTTNVVINPSSLKAKLGTQTSHGGAYGGTTTGAIGWTSGLTDGQIMIGSSSGVPAAANILSADGSIIVTNSANGINISTTGSGFNEIDSLTTDDAVIVLPDVNGNVNVKGNATEGVHTTGDLVTFSVQVNVDHASSGETIAGSITNKVVDPAGLTAKLGTQTSHGAAYGATTAGAIGWTADLTDGQLMIGSSAGVPAAGAITSTDGSIIIVNGHNSIDLSTSGTGHNEVQTVTTDDAVVVHPDAAGNLNLKGDATQGVSTTGNDGTATATVHVAHASDPEAIAGTATNVLVDPVGLKAKLGAQTAKGMPFGAGTTAALGWTNALTNGQIPIGSTAGTPQAGNLTSSDGSITITNGSNTIDLSAAGGNFGWIYTVYDYPAGSTVPAQIETYTLADNECINVKVFGFVEDHSGSDTTCNTAYFETIFAFSPGAAGGAGAFTYSRYASQGNANPMDPSGINVPLTQIAGNHTNYLTAGGAHVVTTPGHLRIYVQKIIYQL